jgi:hypothetical protein
MLWYVGGRNARLDMPHAELDLSATLLANLTAQDARTGRFRRLPTSRRLTRGRLSKLFGTTENGAMEDLELGFRQTLEEVLRLKETPRVGNGTHCVLSDEATYLSFGLH